MEHVLDPNVLVQVVSLSQPPLFVPQKSIAKQPVAPVPWKPVCTHIEIQIQIERQSTPDGQPPQLSPPGVLVQVERGSQPPLFDRHSLMSWQPVAPLPLYPCGQGPQRLFPPGGAGVHVVSGSQPPLPNTHSLITLQPLTPAPV